MRFDQLRDDGKRASRATHCENAKPRFLRIRWTALTFLIACDRSGGVRVRKAVCKRRKGIANPYLLELFHPRSVIRQVVLLDLLNDVIRLRHEESLVAVSTRGWSVHRHGARERSTTDDLQVKSRMSKRTGSPKIVSQKTSDVHKRLTMSVYSSENPSFGATHA
jgi:hypothetical protein